MNTLESLLQKLNQTPETVEFQEVIEVIDKHYLYTPARFSNGPIKGSINNNENSEANHGVINEAGENEGSCKIFAFAQLNQLDETQTLHCFGKYYREDVIMHPDNTDHANIRNFIEYGWAQIHFDKDALSTL